MAAVYPAESRLAVRDSFDDDELTDIDDEVFIRDGKRDLKIYDDTGVKRPLMPPRRKPKLIGNLTNSKIGYKSILLPLCYGGIAIVTLMILMLLCVLAVNISLVPFTTMKNWFTVKEKGNLLNISEVIPCTSLSSSIVWTRTLPKLTSEAPLRSIDVNNDGIEDIILGFSTGLDALDAPEFLCNLYFDGQVPCLGGIMALNGLSGETLWTHWTDHAILSIDCTSDLTDDKTKDCIVTGRGGILHAVNGHDGSTLWELLPIEEIPLSISNQKITLNVYDARFIPDVDGDKISDVIVSHTMQLGRLRRSRVILLSGKTGDNIKTMDFSKREELFIAPQMLVHPDGEISYLLASCTPDQSGGLYIIQHRDLLYGNMDKMKKLQHGKGLGVLLPPILVDLTMDGTEDIIAISLNSTITAYDGLTHKLIWNHTVPNSEIISIPIPGYYNDDQVPDIMIKYQIGPGFPVYYYSATTILDGKTGKSILDSPIKDNANGQMSGLTLSVDGSGNDWFLHWSANCIDHPNPDGKYQFLNGQTLLAQSRANLCKLRYNTTLSMKLLAMSQHVGPPGQSLYSSEEWKAIELNNSIDGKILSDKYTKNLPKIDDFVPVVDIPLVAQRSPRIETLDDPNPISFSDQNDRLIQDVADDYFPESKKLKEQNSELYNEIPEYKKKIVDSVQDWDNLNSWENNPLDKQYEMSYIEDMNRPEISEQDDTDFDPENKYSFMGEENMRGFPNENDLKIIQKYVRRKKENIRENGFNKDKKESVQRQPPTGILLPSLSKSKTKNSVDLIFSTYWLPSSEIPLLLLQKDLDCIRMKEEKIMKELEVSERENIVAECLADRGINYEYYKPRNDRDNVKFGLGQMTVYRMRLQCVCPDDMLPGQSCNNVASKQHWPAHLGIFGNGYFTPFSPTHA